MTVKVGSTGTGSVTTKLDAIHAESGTGGTDIKAGTVTSYDGAGVYATSNGGTVSVRTGDITIEDPTTLKEPWKAHLAVMPAEGFERMVNDNYDNDRTECGADSGIAP